VAQALQKSPRPDEEKAMKEQALVPVKFTEQQLVLIDKVVAEGRMGRTREEVILAMFRDYVRQTLGGEAR
jgi:hypothetical protein